jgi:hypothetical protein
LVWKYGTGVFDGQEIEWSQYIGYGVIDSIIWITIILFFFSNFEKIAKYSMLLAISIFLIQSMSLAYQIIQMPSADSAWNQNVIDGTSKYSFSRDENVIVLLLDAMQSDVFLEIINENPELKETFGGFTYYRNTLAGYPTTYASVPLILTGKYYDNSIPIKQFIKDAFLSDSLPKTLKDNGFRVELYPLVNNTVYLSEDVASNIVPGTNATSSSLEIHNAIFKVTMFRYSPHFAKRFFADVDLTIKRTGDFHEDDLTFAKNINTATAEATEKVFKYIHLKGAHDPFTINENLEEEDLGTDREAYKTQAKAAIKITSMFLNKLKEINAYDNSMIIIVSDHGRGFPIPLGTPTVSDDRDNVFTKMSGGLSTLLIKPFYSESSFTISDIPVTVGDVTKTVLSELGFENEVEGANIFELDEGTTRLRNFYYYTWSAEGFDKSYLPTITEYEITGHSWLERSWHSTGTSYLEGGQVQQIPNYKYGTLIQFGQSGNASPYLQQGWSDPESNFIWTMNKTAKLRIPLEDVNSDILFSANVSPLIFDSLTNQQVSILAGGEKIGSWNVTSSGDYSILVKKDLIKDNDLVLTFVLHNASRPSELGLNSDERLLGLSFSSFTIEKVN